MKTMVVVIIATVTHMDRLLLFVTKRLVNADVNMQIKLILTLKKSLILNKFR